MKKIRHYVLAPSQESALQRCINCGEVMAAWPKFFQPGYLIMYDNNVTLPEDKYNPEIPSCIKPK